MARPRKKGLAYYPKDVDFYQDEKIFELSIRYGPVGVTTYEVLLCMVYREGYYLELTPERAALHVVHTVGGEWYRQERTKKTATEYAAEIIRSCGEIGLFDAELMERGILTSRGIQRRYEAVTSKRRADHTDYWLLDEEKPDAETGISGAETGVSVPETRENGAKMQQRKENKRKENKTKAKKKTARREPTSSGPASGRRRWRVVKERRSERIRKEYGRILPGLPETEVTPKLLRQLAKTGYGVGVYRRVFETAAKSTFLTTPKAGWRCDLEWLCNPANMEKVLSGKYSDFSRYRTDDRNAGMAGSSFETDDFFAAAMARPYVPAETAADCPFL